MLKYDENSGIFTIECDTCGESVEFEADNFKQALAIARKDNWVIKIVGQDTCAFCCSECKNRYIEMTNFVGL